MFLNTRISPLRNGVNLILRGNGCCNVSSIPRLPQIGPKLSKSKTKYNHNFHENTFNKQWDRHWKSRHSGQIVQLLSRAHTGCRVAARTMSSKTPEASSNNHRNRLGLEKSPYLLQHSSNPVDWYPWGEEAFKKAKKENKIIFLSVGYSTCHWCHVMERESFENEDVGKFMSENFVNIKVDREERPDVDRVYMSFIHATTGHGGWPMSVWLTPDLKPIVGGTYFPPSDSLDGRPGFLSILKNISTNWTESREKMDELSTVSLDSLMRNMDTRSGNAEAVTLLPAMDMCFTMLQHNYDEDCGGFGEKPKFPQPVNLNFLLRMYTSDREKLENKVAIKMLTDTLLSMAKGGINDHVNKGFHRYSTDQFWHVPHFEKMLYDQAQLAVVYTDTYQSTKDEELGQVAKDILEYVNRDLSDPSGGFYSAEDADSLATYESEKKQEGAFCVWTNDELNAILSDPVSGHDTLTLADIFRYHFDVKANGNVNPQQDPHGELKNKNVLIIRGSRATTADKFCLSMEETDSILEQCRKILFEVRKKRPPPHLDNKMITSWNGLMISGLARAGQVFGDQTYIDRAMKAANFIKTHMYDQETSRLLRSAYAGENDSVAQIENPIEGFLDDYAFFIRGLIDLYEASFDDSWLEMAERLQEKQNVMFWDKESGGYFSTRADDPSILIRMKEDHDGAEPCANSVSAMNLLKLSHLLQRLEWQQQAAQLFAFYTERLEKIPAALPEMVSALMFLQSPVKQIIIAGDKTSEDTRALVEVVHSHYLPNKVLLLADGQEASFLHQRLSLLSTMEKVEGRATAYVCENYACSLPVNSPSDLYELLSQH